MRKGKKKKKRGKRRRGQAGGGVRAAGGNMTLFREESMTCTIMCARVAVCTVMSDCVGDGVETGELDGKEMEGKTGTDRREESSRKTPGVGEHVQGLSRRFL